jgi:Ser/Thr protein kinase RdoA (MazF antagonist)
VAEGVRTFAETLHRMYTRTGLDDLPAHLGDVHGIDVAGITQLDGGVLKVDRHDGPPWVARVFAAGRPRAEAEGDAAVLRHAEAHAFPAERVAADEPVSVLHGQAVLVTEFIPSARKGAGGKLPGGMGAFLGRLHTLPLPEGPARRPAGGLHHWTDGTRQDELHTAAGWLDQIERRVDPAHARCVERLRAALAEADGGDGLPEAFIHPDPVPKNIVSTTDGGRLVDWTGAGVGPRAVPFEWFLAWKTTAVRYAAAYTAVVPLTDEEWDRLPGIAWGRRLVNLTFRLGIDPSTAGTLAGRIGAARRESEKLVAAARPG